MDRLGDPGGPGRPVRIDLGPVHLWTLGTLLLVFTVVRNLPFGDWLIP
ncbi:hypothetical protein SVIOM342S_04311 [Streptomyces violaceorubidus]